MRTMRLFLQFNTCEDKRILKEVFAQLMDGMSISIPLHCNSSKGHVLFGHRVFSNFNYPLPLRGYRQFLQNDRDFGKPEE